MIQNALAVGPPAIVLPGAPGCCRLVPIAILVGCLSLISTGTTSAAELKSDGKDPKPEIMVPVPAAKRVISIVMPRYELHGIIRAGDASR